MSTDQQFAGTTKGAWVLGTTSFAGIMLAMLGSFQVLQGIAALLGDEIYVTGLNYVYEVDLTTWGWIHLILGAIGIAVGIGIIANNPVANIAGLVVAFLSAISSFAFLPYYPVWSLVILAFDALVIWALCIQIGRNFS